MSFVSKGQKVMHNKAKGAESGNGPRPLKNDSFGKKGQPKNHNMAPASKDQTKEPVSEDAGDGQGYGSEPTANSEYDPASGKRAKSIGDLRSAQKKINERSRAGAASPTGSEGGQDGKHSTSKNTSGFMKGSPNGKMGKMSMKKPRGLASQDTDELEGDPLDEDMEDNEQSEYGMTPQGKTRKSTLKVAKRKLAMMED